MGRPASTGEVDKMSCDVEPSISPSDEQGKGEESNCSPLCSPRELSSDHWA
jgi:hypothetical protein